MSLINRAKEDWQRFTTNLNEFGVEMTLEDLAFEQYAVSGLFTKHHLGIDTEGNLVNTKNAHFSISEQVLTGLNYPIRNADGEVDLKGHKLFVKDSTGVEKSFIIREFFPDETIGLIVCILGTYDVLNLFSVEFDNTFN